MIMYPDNSQNVELLQRRLSAMRQLADSLQDSQSAVVGMDAARIEQFAVGQQRLCQQWRELEEEIRRSGSQSDEQSSNLLTSKDLKTDCAGSKRWNSLLDELPKLERRLRHLNLVHAALLRRMWRSMSALAHVLDNPDGTYVPATALLQTPAVLEQEK